MNGTDFTVLPISGRHWRLRNDEPWADFTMTSLAEVKETIYELAMLEAAPTTVAAMQLAATQVKADLDAAFNGVVP